MASAMKKMAVYLGLVDDGTGRYDDDYDVEAESYEIEHAREPERVRTAYAAPTSGVSTLTDRRPAPTPVVQAPAPAPDYYRITTLTPRSYNDAKNIGLEYREGTPVIMNLTEMDDADAKRLVDFAAGLVFAQRGTIERVTSKVFLLSPANVDVGQETKDRIAEGGFFNQS